MKMTRFSILSFIMLLVIVFIHPYADAQMSQGGVPYSFRPQKANASRGYEQRDLRSQENIPIIEMPALRRGAIDSIKTNYEGQFAYDFSVNIDVKASSWVDSISIGEIYRLKIKSDGAKSLNLIFSKYHLPSGAKLFIYSSDKKSLIGAFTSNNNSESGVLPTTPIYGDEIVIEYFEPCYARSQGKLMIGKVNHDFVGIVANPDTRQRDNEYGYGFSGPCMVDVNCSEGADWQVEKRAVCMIIRRGTLPGSGTLLNNTTFDGTPYVLTANHVISTQQEVDSCIVVFNYESPTCGGVDGDLSQSVEGGTLISTNYATDFTLFELKHKPKAEWNPYYAGWDRHETHGAGGVCIHHPQGDVKKISTYIMAPITSNCQLSASEPRDADKFYLINQWIATTHGFGVTENCSSGSPLFNNQHKVIGQLFGYCRDHNGNCDNPANDYSNYGKLYMSWENYEDNQDEQLKNWLDPIGCDSMVLDGAEVCPYEVNYPEISDNDLIIVYHVNAGAVEIDCTKKNIYSTSVIDSGATVDYWAKQSIHMLPGFHAKQCSHFNAKIGVSPHLTCVPGCFTMTLQVLDSSVYVGDNLCLLQTHAETGEVKFFVDAEEVSNYPINTSSEQACVPITDPNLEPGHYTIRLKLTNECDSLIETFPLEILDTAYHSGGPFYKTKGVDKEEITDIYRTSSSDFSVDVFPNPTQGKVTLQVTSFNQKPYSIEIISPTGSLLYKIERVIEDRIVIDKTGFPSGVYFIRLNNGEQIVTKKMIINK